jgi:hypothetical protein
LLVLESNVHRYTKPDAVLHNRWEV